MVDVKVKFSNHAIQRCSESGVNWRSLAREVSGLNFTGKIKWMTRYGIMVLEKIEDGIVLVKTFIAKHRCKGKQYRNVCYTY